jgi:hypothetical protein
MTKACVLQRSQDSQFLFSSVIDDPNSKEFQSFPKIKIEPTHSITTRNQPRISNSKSRTSKKTKDRLLFCSFAPVSCVGNYSLQDCSLPAPVDIGTSDVLEIKTYSGDRMENDIDFGLDSNEEEQVDLVQNSELTALQVNGLILIQLKELQKKRNFDSPTDMEVQLGTILLI